MVQNPVIFKEYCYSAVIFILTGHLTFFPSTVYNASLSHNTLPITLPAHQFTLVSNLLLHQKPINSDWVRICYQLAKPKIDFEFTFTTRTCQLTLVIELKDAVFSILDLSKKFRLLVHLVESTFPIGEHLHVQLNSKVNFIAYYHVDKKRQNESTLPFEYIFHYLF